MKPLDPIPEIEWWDAFFLPETKPGQPQVQKFPKTQITEKDVYMDRITHYIQHPLPLKNDYIENQNSIVLPLYLT